MCCPPCPGPRLSLFIYLFFNDDHIAGIPSSIKWTKLILGLVLNTGDSVYIKFVSGQLNWMKGPNSASGADPGRQHETKTSHLPDKSIKAAHIIQKEGFCGHTAQGLQRPLEGSSYWELLCGEDELPEQLLDAQAWTQGPTPLTLCPQVPLFPA